MRKELAIARDFAKTGDDSLVRRALRKQLKDAEDAEHRVLAGFAAASRHPARSQKLTRLWAIAYTHCGTAHSRRHAAHPRWSSERIAQTRNELVAEYQLLGELQKELGDDERSDHHALGQQVVGTAFKVVKEKFEDADHPQQRRRPGDDKIPGRKKKTTTTTSSGSTSRARASSSSSRTSSRTFSSRARGSRTPRPRKPEPMPGPGPEGASTSSPDKGGTGDRIKPTGDQGNGATSPTVKPEQQQPKNAPKGSPKEARSELSVCRDVVQALLGGNRERAACTAGASCRRRACACGARSGDACTGGPDARSGDNSAGTCGGSADPAHAARARVAQRRRARARSLRQSSGRA